MEGLGSVVVPTFGLGEHERGEWIAEEAHLSRMRVPAECQRDISRWDDLCAPMRWVVGEENLHNLGFRSKEQGVKTDYFCLFSRY